MAKRTLFASLLAMAMPVHAGQVTHTYDNLNRIIRTDYGNGTAIDFSYDAAGNRLSRIAGANQAPVADAGPDQTVDVGANVVLDGSRSRDPDQGPLPLAYTWSQSGGPGITLANASTTTPGFTPLAAGTYVFALTVYDGLTNSMSDTVTITVNTVSAGNQAPLANAGTDQSVSANTKVTLNGSGSSDPDQGPSPLAYNWVQTGGPNVTLANAATATPDFTPLAASTYVFKLVVNDGLADSLDDTVTITVNPVSAQNQSPIADAGADQTVSSGANVTLDGQGSSDPDQGPAPIAYSWTQTGGPGVTLTNAASGTPGFTPLEAGTYIFKLVVNDGASDSAPDTVTVTVNAPSPLKIRTPNGGEIWNEDSKQTFSWTSANIDSRKRLVLYLSTDNGLTWKKIGGTKNNGSKTWKIPKKRYASKQARVKICLQQAAPLCDTSDAAFTINQAPVAEAGKRQSATAYTEMTLNGGASRDPDNGPAAMTYRWTQLSGPSIVLNGANTASPNFTPEEPGMYVFGLVVNDGSADSKRDKVSVKISANNFD